MMNEKIIIENWTDEPLDNLLGYINTAEEEKRINHSSSKILVFKFENFMVQYEKKKSFDKYTIYKRQF